MCFFDFACCYCPREKVEKPLTIIVKRRQRDLKFQGTSCPIVTLENTLHVVESLKLLERNGCVDDSDTAPLVAGKRHTEGVLRHSRCQIEVAGNQRFV